MANNSIQKNYLNGAEAVVKMLEQYNVEYIFGLCGDTTLPFYDALYRLDHKIEHILTRDERSAAYMADGYARVTKKVGICEGPSGGGATYILPGLVEANESSIPILAITSDVSVNSRGHYPLTELDQESLMRPLTKWNAVISKSEMIPDMIRTAFRKMTTGRPGSAHLGLPIDVQRGEVNPNQIWADKKHATYPAYPKGPDLNVLQDFLNAILSSKFPIIICGGGVVLAGATKELKTFVEFLDIAVATTVSGQGSIPETHSNCVGVVGSNGGVLATREIVNQADLVIFIGCRAGSVTTELWKVPDKNKRIIHIDSDPEVISASYKTEVGIVSDAYLALREINNILKNSSKKFPSFYGSSNVKKVKKKKWDSFNQLAKSLDIPIKPERTIASLRAVLDDDAIIVADPGTPCPYVSAFFEIRTDGRTLFSNRAHGALGYSMSAAMGAWVGRPDKQVVSLMGDGSFAFTCGELETVVRKKMPITFVVFSNSSFGWIKAGQKTGFNKRYYSVDFNTTDHAAVAAAYGVKSWRVEDPNELQKILNEPTLVDIISQPLEEANAPVSEWIA